MVATYFGKLKVLWDELANSDKIPSCTCGGCKCGIDAQLEKRREEEKVHQLLMGLDDASYGTVRSNILASDPLSSLNRVYAMLVRRKSENDGQINGRKGVGRGSRDAGQLQRKRAWRYGRKINDVQSLR